MPCRKTSPDGTPFSSTEPRPNRIRPRSAESLPGSQALGVIRAFGVEGTGTYGAGLSRFLCEHGHRVFEVNRPNRQLRRQKGKDDLLDAESAARSVLAGHATALPKSGTSAVEMIRHLKVSRAPRLKPGAKPCRR
jgi:transposase